MIRRFSTVVVAVAMLAGCDALPVPPSAELNCTLIGCESQVRFELEVDLRPGETYEIEACLDEECVTKMVRVPQQGAGVREPVVV